jgi:SAM-dependent methyltransferase
MFFRPLEIAVFRQGMCVDDLDGASVYRVSDFSHPYSDIDLGCRAVSMKDLTECIVCGASSFDARHGATFRGRWDEAAPYFLTNRVRAVHGGIVRCRECGFVATSPRFSTEEYARIYRQVGTVEAEEGRRAAAATRYRKLARKARRFRDAGRFLDLGCGDGGFLGAMDGFDGQGFEVRADDGQGRMNGDNIVVGDFLEFAADAAASFDFVTAWDVLEHFADLDGYMTSIHRVLKDRGHLFCTLPNIGSLAARFSGQRWNCLLLEHLWYFNPETFGRYALRFGFEVLSVEPFLYPVDIQTLLRRFAQTHGGGEWRLPSLLADRVIGLPIGIMSVVCRKT